MPKILFLLMLSLMTFHGIIMTIDEFYFHHKRGLPKWERIGHPIDTFFFLICVFIPCFFHYNTISLYTFFIFSLISCLIIVKDEKIHLTFCNAKEQTLHALLFVTHPLLLLCIFTFWKFQNKFIFSKYILQTQFAMVLLFLIYQIVYWNFLKKEKHDSS